MSTVNHGIDRVRVTFDDETLVADAGLLLVATLSARLGLEALIDATVGLVGRVGGARPGRKVLTLVHAMLTGADCIDDTDRLRAGATGAVLGHRVMAPSTLGTFLRSFTFGHRLPEPMEPSPRISAYPLNSLWERSTTVASRTAPPARAGPLPHQAESRRSRLRQPSRSRTDTLTEAGAD